MKYWNDFTNLLRRVDGLLDGAPRLADSPAGDVLSEWAGREVDELVIDVSHSMDMTDYKPSRLAGAVRAASQFLKRRAESNPDALAGIVSFCWRARMIAPLQPLRANLAAALEALEGLSTGNATNIAAGLSLASREVKKIVGVRTSRVLLLTDGHSTMGDNPEEVAAMVKEGGTQLDIIGIGGSPEDVNVSVLKEMASIVNGERRYWFIKSVGELVEKFEALALREFH